MTQEISSELFNSEEMEQLDPSKSLFLKQDSRHWAKHLSLKSSLFAACLLLTSFILSFFPLLLPISNLLLFSISGAIEHSVLSKAKGTLHTLNTLSPKKAHVIVEKDKILERSLHDITVGTSILIKAGEVIPLDGTVIDGASSLDLGHLTGESLPIRKTIGDSIPAGAHNLEGVLTLKVTQTSSNSTLSRIIRLITEAQENKPKLQRWIDKFSRLYAITNPQRKKSSEYHEELYIDIKVEKIFDSIDDCWCAY